MSSRHKAEKSLFFCELAHVSSHARHGDHAGGCRRWGSTPLPAPLYTGVDGGMFCRVRLVAGSIVTNFRPQGNPTVSELEHLSPASQDDDSDDMDFP